jgi:hypothetical protein
MSDEELSAEARNLIASVRAERTLSPAERERSYARIGVGIGVAASGVFAARSASAAGSSGAAAAGQSLVLATKWWVIGGLLVTAGAAGLGAYAGSRSGASERAQSLSPPKLEAPAPSLLPPVEPRMEGPLPISTSSAPAPIDAERKAGKVKGASAPVPPGGNASPRLPATTTSAVTTATSAEEVLLLHRARAALRSNPAHAASLARRHEQRYPRSQLAAEREVVTILALCGLGRTSDAERRAKALASRSPALAALEGSCAERR